MALAVSRTASLTPARCRNHPHNDHYIVENYEVKGPGSACTRSTCASCAEGFSCKQPAEMLPVLGWLPGYLATSPLKSTLSDAICGITVAVVVIPQGMAYGLLAGVPPVYGLYTSLLPPLAYTLLGSCMHLAVGPFALISMLTAAGIQQVVPNPDADPTAAVAAAAVIALFSGLVLVALSLLRLGFIATLLSDPVLSGYTTAVSVIIPTSQLKYALQVSLPRGGFITTVAGLVEAIGSGHVHVFALGIFLVSTFLLLTLQAVNRSARFPRLKKFPIPAELLVVILSTAVCGFLDAAQSVSVLGKIEKGLPPFAMPQLGRFDLHKLISPVLMVSLMTYITAMSVSKTFARKYGYEVDNNQELLALGCSNIVGSLSSCFPAAASLSRTAIVGNSGAATPLHNLWTVVVLVVVLLFCSPLIATLPFAALAAIVAVSFKSLLLNGFEEMKFCWRVGLSDFIMWSVAFWSTLATDVTVGIAIAVGADILCLLWKSTLPSYTVLGRLGGTERLYRSRHHFVEAKAIPRLLIFRFDGSLHFANREVFATKVWHELRTHDAEFNGKPVGASTFWATLLSLSGNLWSKRPAGQSGEGESQHVQRWAVKAVVLDFSPISQIDMSGIRTLEKLRSALAARGTRLVLAHCKYVCYQKLLAMGFFNAFEASGRYDVVCFRDLHDAVLFAEGRLPLPERGEASEVAGVPSRSGTISLTASVAGTGTGVPPGPPCHTTSRRSLQQTLRSMLTVSASDPEASPQVHRRCARQATVDWLEEQGVAVGHEDRGHHEPLANQVQAEDGAANYLFGRHPASGESSAELPRLLSRRTADLEDLERGIPKVRRASSEGQMAGLGSGGVVSV